MADGSEDPDAPCDDCGVATAPSPDRQHNYYMVSKALWPSECEWLCIPCLEARLGRQLRASDFPDFPVNWPFFPNPSDALAAALAR